MSGHLQFSTESTEIRKTTNVGYLILRGGTTYNDSANVLIYGNDNTNNAGQVILRGGSGTVGIVINKDGTTSVNTPTTTDTLTLDSTYATAHSAGQNCHWYRIGKIVRICLDVDVTGCTTLKTIGTLPYNAGSYTVLNIHNFSSDTQGAETAFVNDRLLRIKVPANARYIITGFYMAQ